MQISEDVIHLLDLHNSSHHTQHHKEAKLNLIIYHYQVRIRTVWMCRRIFGDVIVYIFAY